MLKWNKIKNNHSRRAVAPIIATLLMVAISVVGGILIFVFAQGFFTDTNVQGPTIDSIIIFGYDARDAGDVGNPECTAATSLASHLGTDGCITGATGAADGKLSDGDGIMIYIRNNGAGDVVIDTVRVRGEAYEADPSGAVAAGTNPINLEFCVVAPIAGTVDATANCIPPIIRSGEERSIYIDYEAAFEGPIKIGRPILIKIITGNGAVFPLNLQNGVVRGVG